MSDDNREKWYRLPKFSFNKRVLKGRLRQVENATVRHAHKFIVKRWNNMREVQWRVMAWIVMVGALIAATGLQLMWYQNSYKTTAAARDGIYAEAVLGPVDTLNPLFAVSSAEQSAAKLMFSSLMKYDKSGRLNNDLATSISVSDDFNTYTVNIRPNVKWHDGQTLTSNDIAFTIGLIKNQNARTVISGLENISVKVLDDTSIQFNLQSSYAAFEHILTFPIVPQHILKDIAPSAIRENGFSQNPIGTGPFQLRLVQNVESGNARKIIRMSRNDNYYSGKPNLLRFQLHVYDSHDSIIKALASNEINATADLLPGDVSKIDKNNYFVSSRSIQNGMYAILNTKSSLLSDVNVRRALQMATNTTAIRDALPKETKSLDLPFTDGQLSGDAPKVAEYNPDKSRQLLINSGWRQNDDGAWIKDGKELRLSLITIKGSEFEHALETIASQWRPMGILLDTRVVDPTDISNNVVQTVLRPRNFDVLIYQLNIGADPDVYAYWHSSQMAEQGYNFSNYSSVISDDALSSARVKADSNLRNAKYITFANQWIKDVPAIGLYQTTMQYVHSDNSRAMSDSDKLVSPTDRYSDIINWSVGSQTVYKTP